MTALWDRSIKMALDKQATITAKRMIRQYGAYCVAQEMTFYHKTDRPFWRKVWNEIQRLYELEK